LSAQAVLAQCQAEYNYAVKEYDRKKELFQKNAVAKYDYEDAERLVDFTKAKIDEARASVMQAENELSYTRIYAPLTGRIGKSTYSVGNYVTPNSEALADIVQIDPINVRFSLDERNYLDKFAGSSEDKPIFRVLLANGKKFAGEVKIDFVDNRVDKATGTVTIWLECTNPDAQLIPDGFATVQLVDQFAHPLVAVNVSAMMNDRGNSYVYVVDADNVVERRDLTLGPMVGDMQTVLSGLKEGDQVIVQGTHKTQPGAKVTPTGANAPDGQAR